MHIPIRAYATVEQLTQVSVATVRVCTINAHKGGRGETATVVVPALVIVQLHTETAFESVLVEMAVIDECTRLQTEVPFQPPRTGHDTRHAIASFRACNSSDLLLGSRFDCARRREARCAQRRARPWKIGLGTR